MTVYYILMLIIMGLAYPLCIRKPSDKKNIVYVSIVFLYMFIISSIRYGIGYDYSNYKRVMHNIVEEHVSIKNSGVETGYYLFMKLIGLLGGEYMIHNVLIALLILLPAAVAIIKYSKMPWMSCWLYLTVTFFYTSMNFTRQSFAVSVIFLSYYFIKEKKHILFILIICAASLFHFSVLIMIPVYIMSILVKPTLKSLIILSAAGITAFVMSKQLIILALTTVFKQYSKYLDTLFLDSGLSLGYLVIPLMLTAIVLTAYFMGWKDKCPEAAVLANFSFYSSFIWLFITKHFILERFSMPVYIFIILTIPEVLCFFKEKGEENAQAALSVVHGKHLAHPEKIMRESLSLRSSLKSKAVFLSLTAVIVVSTFIYNEYCSGVKAHGVFPYKSIFDAAPQATAKELKKEYRILFFKPSLQECMSMIKKGDYTTVICVKGNAGSCLDLPSRMILRSVGFKTDFNSLDGRSYVGAVDNGKVLFEMISDGVIEEKFTVSDNSFRVMAVSGGDTAESQHGLIIVDDYPYTPDTNGLNIAIFDNEQKKIAGAVAYDTTHYTYPCTSTTAFVGEILTDE